VSEHRQEHEGLVERILVGDLDETADEARAVLDSCAECRDEFAGMRAITAELDAAGRHERHVLEDAHALDDAPGLDAVGPVASGPRPTARPQRTAWIVALAAGLMLAFVLKGSFTIDEGGAGEVQMGGEEIVLGSPSGSVPAFVIFEWTAERAENESFELLIWDDGAQALETPIERVQGIEATQWTPGQGKTDGWRTIRWRVDLYDDSGEFVRSSPVQHSSLE